MSVSVGWRGSRSRGGSGTLAGVGGGVSSRGGEASTSPGRAAAASRRAQSWNAGQTGNADARQYACWWASARGAGIDSAKQRWR